MLVVVVEEGLSVVEAEAVVEVESSVLLVVIKACGL